MQMSPGSPRQCAQLQRAYTPAFALRQSLHAFLHTPTWPATGKRAPVLHELQMVRTVRREGEHVRVWGQRERLHGNERSQVHMEAASPLTAVQARVPPQDDGEGCPADCALGRVHHASSCLGCPATGQDRGPSHARHQRANSSCSQPHLERWINASAAAATTTTTGRGLSSARVSCARGRGALHHCAIHCCAGGGGAG